ncbi:septal ring lytic transglycosylase RlpA family protein [Aidingimonas halophila]|uniref:Endolytic peptidoglycan transglycosylase RlpA n=1 Tax=Aidingimonas halophila TaxID=574349 RepID=A0A1H3AY72_9GAMM|nr:septal ring lytic transglycosylase RlpA family protein [Aidingimonas halophila]GHC25583.1 endolytic peptidoglycan transglycosylase RlpA [Aidingimonas halophila]SDX34637.1 rare lipoprotein A [Aidingimonas halophila]
MNGMTMSRYARSIASCLALISLLAGCASSGSDTDSPRSDSRGQTSTDAPDTATGRYSRSEDAYPDLPPDVSDVPNAEPRVEPRSRRGNTTPYEVLGKQYYVLDDAQGYENRGTASWYGEKFHGYTTSNGEIYDMYKMTAAHKSLPLPSYARVTNVDNGRSVIVKVNDRGPFHDDREIDLSYAAAARLEILGEGTGRVRVEVIDPRQWQREHGSSGQLAERVDDREQRVASADSSQGRDSTFSEAVDMEPSGEVGESARRAARIMAVEDKQESDEPARNDNDVNSQHVFLQVAALGSSSNARSMQSRLQEALEQPVRVASDSGIHRVQVGPLGNEEDIEPIRERLRQTGIEQTVVVRTQH